MRSLAVETVLNSLGKLHTKHEPLRFTHPYDLLLTSCTPQRARTFRSNGKSRQSNFGESHLWPNLLRLGKSNTLLALPAEPACGNDDDNPFSTPSRPTKSPFEEPVRSRFHVDLAHRFETTCHFMFDTADERRNLLIDTAAVGFVPLHVHTIVLSGAGPLPSLRLRSWGDGRRLVESIWVDGVRSGRCDDDGKVRCVMDGSVPWSNDVFGGWKPFSRSNDVLRGGGNPGFANEIK